MSETNIETAKGPGCFQIGSGVALVLLGFFLAVIGLILAASWSQASGVWAEGVRTTLNGFALLAPGVAVLVNAAKKSKAARTQAEKPKLDYPNDGIVEHDNPPEGQ